MNKAVQIPESLFFDICRYFLADPAEPDSEDLQEVIQKGLTDKLEAMQRRAAYSAYKDKSQPIEAREAARQQYLDLIGMRPGFRWDGLNPS